MCLGESGKIILVGNKADLTQNRLIQLEQGVQKAEQLQVVTYLETSVKTGDEIEYLLHTIVENIDVLQPLQERSAETQNVPEKNESQSSCC